MAKFIIEISDEQIRDLANADKLKEQVEKDKSPMKVLFDMIAGVSVIKKLDEGVTEFNISRDTMGDRDEPKEFFDRNVGDICLLAFFAMKEGKSEQSVVAGQQGDGSQGGQQGQGGSNVNPQTGENEEG